MFLAIFKLRSVRCLLQYFQQSEQCWSTFCVYISVNNKSKSHKDGSSLYYNLGEDCYLVCQKDAEAS